MSNANCVVIDLNNCLLLVRRQATTYNHDKLTEAECTYGSLNSTTIGSDSGLSPGRRQSIIWTNAGILLIGPPGKF